MVYSVQCCVVASDLGQWEMQEQTQDVRTSMRLPDDSQVVAGSPDLVFSST